MRVPHWTSILRCSPSSYLLKSFGSILAEATTVTCHPNTIFGHRPARRMITRAIKCPRQHYCRWCLPRLVLRWWLHVPWWALLHVRWKAPQEWPANWSGMIVQDSLTAQKMNCSECIPAHTSSESKWPTLNEMSASDVNVWGRKSSPPLPMPFVDSAKTHVIPYLLLRRLANLDIRSSNRITRNLFIERNKKIIENHMY